jgi:hypothetical protein
MATVFMDEAGFTGTNWLDPQQPIFALGSLLMEETAAEQMKAQFFSRVRAKELKFSDLCKRPSHRSALLAFLDELLRSPERIAITQMDKRFALVGKMVDTLVENALHGRGLNLYEDGRHKLLTNALYFGVPHLSGDKFFDDLLSRFQALTRDPSPQHYDDFFFPLTKLHHSGELGELLGWLALGDSELGQEDVLRTCRDTVVLDAATPSVFSLVGFWASQEQDLTVVHDSSSLLAADRSMWEAYASESAPAMSVHGSVGEVSFPLPVKEFRFEEPSDTWAGLQLADLVAGCVTFSVPRLRSGNVGSGFEKELITRVGEFRSVFSIVPGDVAPVFSGDDAQRIIDYGVELKRSLPKK